MFAKALEHVRLEEKPFLFGAKGLFSGAFAVNFREAISISEKFVLILNKLVFTTENKNNNTHTTSNFKT